MNALRPLCALSLLSLGLWACGSSSDGDSALPPDGSSELPDASLEASSDAPLAQDGSQEAALPDDGAVSDTGSDSSLDSAADSAEAGCSALTCSGPGQVCVGDQCITDCRRSGANPCSEGTVCNVGSEQTGQCLAPDSSCVISSPAQTCEGPDGGAFTQCGPGTLCDGRGGCYPTPPCRSMTCEHGSCWGLDCSCTRPAPTCAPAPLGSPGESGTLNDYVFTRCGTHGSCDGGIFDLDFDQQCNAWAVTMISGPDYLRKISPTGQVTEITGVTNLNMGEVAAIQGYNGQFGGGLLEVALSYVCCASCGCQISGSGGHPQGVASYDPDTQTLPMQIPSSTFTSGQGPFGNGALDTGPYGLSWGLDRVLYVGNIDTNGDYYALDLETGSKELVLSLPSRIFASAPYDKTHMLVAVQGGDVYLVPTLGWDGQAQKIATLSGEVTSLVRDSWSGVIYAELNTLEIVSFKADGSPAEVFQTAPAKGRITIAPDGYLYHLTPGWPTSPAIVRWALPSSL